MSLPQNIAHFDLGRGLGGSPLFIASQRPEMSQLGHSCSEAESPVLARRNYDAVQTIAPASWFESRYHGTYGVSLFAMFETSALSRHGVLRDGFELTKVADFRAFAKVHSLVQERFLFNRWSARFEVPLDHLMSLLSTVSLTPEASWVDQ